VDLPSTVLARIKELYAQGHYRQALDAAEGYGPPRGWSGPAARLIGGRLAIQLGAPRMGRRLHLLAFRESPAYQESVYYHARYRMERFGPLSCWRFQEQHTDWSEASPELRADWLALRGLTAARFRDFDRADAFFTQSETMAPHRPWHHVERSSALELAEKTEDALAAARRSLELQAWFRPGIQSVAQLLTRMGREREALDLLVEAVEHLESALVVSQLAGLQLDLGQVTDAGRSIERFAELSPLIEKELSQWLAARRSDVFYLLGDRPKSAEHARLADDEFYTAFAERLTVESLPLSASERGPGGEVSTIPPERLILPLDLTHTGPPPTAYDLHGKFWDRPVPMAGFDDSPGTDGLPDYAERQRFDAANWTTREFTLSTEAARTLIGRRLPFFCTLVETGYPQVRLVIGFDPVRETIFFADGFERKPIEAPIQTLFKRYAGTGPRCLLAVPPGSNVPLEDLPLPDISRYDRLFRLQTLLADRRFSEAKVILDGLQASDPTHRVSMTAALAWAKATSHQYLQLDALNALLMAFPHDPTYALAKASVVRDLGRIHERLDFLVEEGGRADSDPLLMQSLAQIYLADFSKQHEADRLLRQSLRQRPHAASGYFLLAAQKWEEQEFDIAIELYRMATCLDDREEQFADAYVRAAKPKGKLPDAVRLLQKRAARGERPSPTAVRSLYHALIEHSEPVFAQTALGKALEKLTAIVKAADKSPPTASIAIAEATAARLALGDLRLFRAEQNANVGKFAEAQADLAAAEPHATKLAWAKSAARVARTKPEFTTALGHLRIVLAGDPLQPEAHRLAIGLLTDTAGKTAARAHLTEYATRFPFVYPILKLRSEYLTPDSDDAGLRATEDLLDLCQHDAWAHRQLALAYGDRRRHPEALAAAMKSGETEPDHPSHYAVLANVHRRADRTEEAIAAFREGLTKYVDHDLAITEMVRTARGAKEKKAALQFVADQLHAQPHSGEGLMTYRDQSLQLIDDPEEQERFYAELEQFLEERPDLWQCWSIVIQQMIMMHRAEEAKSLARQAVDRFPLTSRLWMDLAEACRVTEQTEDRIEALRRAVDTSPGWTQPAKELSDALHENEEREEAVTVLEQHVRKSPLDPLGYGFLAEQYWDAGRSEEALASAERAVRHEPGYDWAWGAVANWGDRLEKPDAVVDLARELALDRAGDPRVWMKLARSLHKFEQTEEALAALDRAIALDPKNPDPFDLKAERLAEVGRFDEALATTRPPELVDDLPLTLQGRAAWIEARRGNYAAAIPPMQALVSVDPDYYWGWQQLADWYNETGRSEAYLEAAEQLCRLRPEHPTPLTMRGEAKLQNDDRDSGKSDLRDALRIHPAYSPAAAILFDACLADGELKEARSALAVLQEHMAGPEGLVKQIVYAVKTNDEESAVRAFRLICEHADEGSPTLLQMGLMELKGAGWEPRAYEQMGEAWRSGEPFNPWAALLWLDTPLAEAAELDDRLAACQAVMREYPTFVPVHDRMAEQLARSGKFDAAISACTPAAITPTPLTLRGRAAWIVALRGDREKAIDMMRKAVAEDPDYTWGWRQITHWTDDLSRHQECLEAAEHLVRLAPDDPYSFGIRGEAKRILGDHRGARDDYQKAYELDPQFEAAGQQLINEQLATDDLPGAAGTLARLREHADGPLLKLRAIQVAARQKLLAIARSALRSLATDIAASRSLVREGARALDEEGWAAEADAELADLLLVEDVNPAAAAAWVERLVADNRGSQVEDRLKEVAEKNPTVGREAALVYAWGMAATDGPEEAAATVQRFAELIRATDDGWARAGAILAEVRKYPLAVAWLSDYPKREDCEPWMLRALADSHRALGDDVAATAVLEAAFEIDEDDLPADMTAWLALSAALAGDTATANGHLDGIDRLGLPDGTKLILALTDGLVLVQEADPAEIALAFSEAKVEWKTAAAACAPRDLLPGTARWYRRCVSRLVTDTGTLRGRLWGWYQKFSPLVKEV